jgi:hypothetical protein
MHRVTRERLDRAMGATNDRAKRERERVMHALKTEGRAMSLDQLMQATDIPKGRVMLAVNRLIERMEVVRDAPGFYAVRGERKPKPVYGGTE